MARGRSPVAAKRTACISRHIIRRHIRLLCLLHLCWGLLVVALSTPLPAAAAETGPPASEAPEPPRLRVAYDPDFAPFHFVQNGQLQGFAVDLLSAMAERAGYVLDWRPMSRWQSVDALQQDDIDLIVSMNYMAELNDRLAFTEPYFISSAAIVVPVSDETIHNLLDLSEKVVALQGETPEFELLKNIRRVRFHWTTHAHDALQLLVRQRADAFFGNAAVARYWLEQQGLAKQYRFVESHFLPLEMSIAVRKEKQRLLNQLNDALRQVQRDSTYDRLYQRWFNDGQAQLVRQIRHLLWLLSGLSVLAAVLIIGGLYWNRLLQQEVNKKTRQLQQVNASLQEQIRETKNSQRFKEQILDSSPRGIVTCDRDGRITSINHVAMAFLGRTDRPLAQHYSAFPLFARLLDDTFAAVIDEGRRFLGREIAVDMPSASTAPAKTVHLRYYIYPLYDVEQRIDGLILSFEDITEELKMRASLFEQEKNRTLNQLVAGLAHEIRNPLTAIKTFAELLPQKGHVPAFQQAMAYHVPREIDRLNQLIENLIDYAKPRQMARMALEVEPLVQSCLFLFENSLQDKGIHLVRDIPPDLWVMADASAVKQVLINVLLNAIDALEQRRRQEPAEQPLTLTIRAAEEDAAIRLAVEDEGIGMDELSRQRAFEPFFTTKPHGTGLGLALSRQLIQENNGELLLESMPDKGTRVTIILPKGARPDEEALDHRR